MPIDSFRANLESLHRSAYEGPVPADLTTYPHLDQASAFLARLDGAGSQLDAVGAALVLGLDPDVLQEVVP